MQDADLPSQMIASLTSNGYCISPSTSPGVSTNVTKLNFFCFEVEISVERKSNTPAQTRALRNYSGKHQHPKVFNW